MAEPLSDRIIHKIERAADLYYRLIVLVAPTGAGKTTALQDVHKRIDYRFLNLNLELSQRMLELTERQRILQLPLLLSDVVSEFMSEVILPDNIELLFDTSLKQDPLRLLQGISRNKTIVAAWSGSIEGDYIIYAKPDHPEYRRYPLKTRNPARRGLCLNRNYKWT